MADSLSGAIIRAIKEGLSARAALRSAREVGVKIRDATWYRAYGEAKRALANQITEASRPLNRRPTGGEISTWSTRTHSGFIQYVDVFVKDKRSGLIVARPYAVRSRDLVTREAAMRKAIDAMQASITDRPEEYEEDILFAAYTATYQMTPRE